jgi:glycosyltransferase involved in cell wall biosynthesis
MPVYNAERYLARAVESVLAQTYGDFEVLALDDGSTDRSPAILRHYAHRDDRLRVVRRPQPTLGALLNVGIDAARGMYVARMDADDVCRPRRLERQVQYLDAHPDVGIVGTGATIIDPEGYPLGPRGHPHVHDAIVRSLLDGNGAALTHPALLMRRDVVLNAGGYPSDRRTCEDVALFLRVAGVARLANIREDLLLYRTHKTSVCHTDYRQQRRDLYDLIAAERERRGWPPPPRSIATAGREQHYDRPGYLRLLWMKQALRSGYLRSALHNLREAFREHPGFLLDWPLLRIVLPSPRRLGAYLQSLRPFSNPP